MLTILPLVSEQIDRFGVRCVSLGQADKPSFKKNGPSAVVDTLPVYSSYGRKCGLLHFPQHSCGCLLTGCRQCRYAC